MNGGRRFAAPLAGLACLLGFMLSAPAAQPAGAYNPRDLNGVWDNGGGVGNFAPTRDAKGNLCIAGNCGGKADLEFVKSVLMKPPFPNYKTEFKAKLADLQQNHVTADPSLRCGNPGVPRIGAPDKIIQTPTQFVFLYDDLTGAYWRIVPLTDTHRADAEESFLGDAIARWEGNTLVVESTSFNDISWLADNGAFHTNKMKVIERLWREGDTLSWQATVHDPDVLLEPFVTYIRKGVLTRTEPLEPAACLEQSIDKMVEKGPENIHGNPR